MNNKKEEGNLMKKLLVWGTGDFANQFISDEQQRGRLLAL